MLPFEKKTWKSLDELDAGVCDGMTYEEIEVGLYPENERSLMQSRVHRRSIRKITRQETRTSLITGIEVESRIVMWWLDLSRLSWSLRDRRTFLS
jgi:hypothetical protein